jgi:hypothetical protein
LAFQQLVRCLNSRGRIYIWVYGTPKYADLAAYTASRRRDHWLKPFVVPLPSPLQRIVLFPMAFRNWARSRLKGGGLEMSFARSMVLAFDYYTPYYRSHHHFEEVQEWFRSERLVGITLAGVTEAGFGLFGSRMI